MIAVRSWLSSQNNHQVAVYFVQQDGELETVTGNNQRTTYCVFDDGEHIEHESNGNTTSTTMSKKKKAKLRHHELMTSHL